MLKKHCLKYFSQFYKQKNGYTMCGPISVIFSDIYLSKTESEVVNPSIPQFYNRLIDNIINRRSKGQPNKLFENLNNSDSKISYRPPEVKPNKFLDPKKIYEHNKIATKTFLQRTEVHGEILPEV